MTDEYDRLTDRREPDDDRSADEIVLDMQAKLARGRAPTIADFDMLVTAFNYLSGVATDAQLDECAVRMKAEGAQRLPSNPVGSALGAWLDVNAAHLKKGAR